MIATPERISRAAWGLLAAAILGMLFALVAGQAQHAGSTSSSDSSTGRVLAEELNLGGPVQTEAALKGNCRYFAEVEDGVGYCLDNVTSDPEGVWVLQKRITGHVPTAAEIEVHELQTRVSELAQDEETADQAELRHALDDLSAALSGAP